MQQTLAELGYAAPTLVQASAIPVILAGRDLMAGAQTGTGKTAAFVLPLLEQLLQNPTNDAPSPIRALVLVPTRELAVQVHERHALRQGHRPHQHAGLRRGEYRGAGGGAESRGGYPDRHPGPAARSSAAGALSLAALRHLVFDEADRMLDMGFMDGSRRC